MKALILRTAPESVVNQLSSLTKIKNVSNLYQNIGYIFGYLVS